MADIFMGETRCDRSPSGEEFSIKEENGYLGGNKTDIRPDEIFCQELVKFWCIQMSAEGSRSCFCETRWAAVWEEDRNYTHVFLCRHEPHGKHCGVEANDSIEDGVLWDLVQKTKEVATARVGWWVISQGARG